MRVLLALSTLLLLPGVAQAKPVCGPSTNAHTLASNGEARVYRSSTQIFGCSRGHAPVALASRAKLAGRRAAAVRGSRLRVYNLSARSSRAVSGPGAKVHGFAVNADGVAAWVEDSAGGVRRVRASRGGTLDTGDGIDKGFVHLAGRAVSWRHGPYVRFGAYQDIAYPHYDIPRLGEDLGTYADVTFSEGPDGLHARYRDGRSVSLFDQYVSRVAFRNGEVSGTSGIDAARVNGTTVAVRNDFSYIDAVDLTGIGPLRSACGNGVGAATDFVVSRSGSVACVVTGTVNTVETGNVTLDPGGASIGSLRLNGDKLSWRNGAQTRTAPLPPGVYHAVTEPCGPASAGTFARTATSRAYALHGRALVCETGSKRTFALGSAGPILGLELNGRYAAITRAAGNRVELRVRDVRTRHAVGRRVTTDPGASNSDPFATVVVSQDGLAVFATDGSLGDTAGTHYALGDEVDTRSVKINGDVVSWIDIVDDGGRDEADYLRIQPVRHAHGLDLPQRDGPLGGLYGFAFALEGGQVVARVGAGPLTPLGAVTAAVLWPAGTATVKMSTAAGTMTYQLPTS